MTAPAEQPPVNGATAVTARCYTFPRRFLYPEILLFSSVFALGATAWIPAIYSLYKLGTVLPSVLRAAAAPGITAAVVLVLVLFIKYEIRKVRFLLTDELLIRQSPQHVRKMPLLGIESITLTRFPGSGGIVSVSSGCQTIHIPLIVRHVRDLVARLKEACAETAIAAQVTDAMWRVLDRRSALAEISARRAARAYKPLFAASVIAILVAVITGLFFWDLPFIALVAWSAAAPFCPVASFATADFILRLREQREYAKKGDDNAASYQIDEAKIIVRTGIVFFLLYLCAGIIFRTFAQ